MSNNHQNDLNFIFACIALGATLFIGVVTQSFTFGFLTFCAVCALMTYGKFLR